MILYYRTLPKTVGAVRHKDQNAYRGLSILIRLQETLLLWYSRAFFISVSIATAVYQNL